MIRSGQKERWIIYTVTTLLCLVLASFWLMCNIYARYTSEASGIDEARVALWGNSQSITLAEGNELPSVPGETCKYTLLVSNQNSNAKVSEVAQKYSIEVLTEGNLPLTYTLSKDNTPIGKTFSETASQKTGKFEDDGMIFQAGKEETHTYTLTVTWAEGQNSASLTGIPDAVQIMICTEQVD